VGGSEQALAGAGMLGTMLAGHAVRQRLAVHQPGRSSAASLRPARLWQRALRGLESEFCVSTECHLVGFHFITRVAF